MIDRGYDAERLHGFGDVVCPDNRSPVANGQQVSRN